MNLQDVSYSASLWDVLFVVGVSATFTIYAFLKTRVAKALAWPKPPRMKWIVVKRG